MGLKLIFVLYLKGGFLLPAIRLAFFMPRKGGLQMADDKKNIPDVASPTEAPAPTVENVAAPEKPAPEAEKEQAQPPDPGKDNPTPAHSGKVVDFAVARDEAAKDEKKEVKQMRDILLKLMLADLEPV